MKIKITAEHYWDKSYYKLISRKTGKLTPEARYSCICNIANFNPLLAAQCKNDSFDPEIELIEYIIECAVKQSLDPKDKKLFINSVLTFIELNRPQAVFQILKKEGLFESLAMYSKTQIVNSIINYYFNTNSNNDKNYFIIKFIAEITKQEGKAGSIGLAYLIFRFHTRGDKKVFNLISGLGIGLLLGATERLRYIDINEYGFVEKVVELGLKKVGFSNQIASLVANYGLQSRFTVEYVIDITIQLHQNKNKSLKLRDIILSIVEIYEINISEVIRKVSKYKFVGIIYKKHLYGIDVSSKAMDNYSTIFIHEEQCKDFNILTVNDRIEFWVIGIAIKTPFRFYGTQLTPEEFSEYKSNKPKQFEQDNISLRQDRSPNRFDNFKIREIYTFNVTHITKSNILILSNSNSEGLKISVHTAENHIPIRPVKNLLGALIKAKIISWYKNEINCAAIELVKLHPQEITELVLGSGDNNI